MAVNYHGKEFYNIGFMVANLNTMVIYSEILSLEIVRLNLPRYFYNIGSWGGIHKASYDDHWDMGALTYIS